MALVSDVDASQLLTFPLDVLLAQHLDALRLKSYSEYTVRNRLVHIRLFLRWCSSNGISTAAEITPPVLQRYQQFTLNYRKSNGQPIAAASRHARLVPLRVWFRWIARQGRIADLLSGEVELPRLGRPLPRCVLSAREVERVLSQPDVGTSIGVRDRAILEVFYSTGIRRLELVHLEFRDLLFDRKLIFIREGKGKRDRYVPVGQRATEWIGRYIRDARPAPAEPAFSETVFLSRHGRPLNRDHLTWIARQQVAKAKLGRTGACHLFRHTMATLMHQNGADIRFVQEILGHADIRTTQIYTQVSLRMLQRVYNRTHPAA